MLYIDIILVSFFLFVFLRMCVCCFLLNACYLFDECFSVILTFSQFAVGHTCIVSTVLGSYLIIKLGHWSLLYFCWFFWGFFVFFGFFGFRPGYTKQTRQIKNDKRKKIKLITYHNLDHLQILSMVLFVIE